MSKMYYDNDCSKELLNNLTVAVIGYGSQGHAHAQNLRDSGVNVVVGLYENSKSAAVAKADGFEVLNTPDAVKKADWVMMLVNDEKMDDPTFAVTEDMLREGVKIRKGKKVFLMGGGIGVPPILQLAKELEAEKQVVVGYRDSNLFLKEDLDKYATVYVATEDGSVGTKGNVMNAIEANALEAEVIFACGPMPMLRAIKQYAAKKGIKAYISLEEHMACGVGACLGCVVKTKEVDHHSHVNNARICTDGPVFDAEDVEI